MELREEDRQVKISIEMETQRAHRDNLVHQKKAQVRDHEAQVCVRETYVCENEALVRLQQLAMRKCEAELAIASLNADRVQVSSRTEFQWHYHICVLVFCRTIYLHLSS